MDELTQIATLPEMYQYICQKGPTYRQHAEMVHKMAQKYATIAEIGLHEMISGFSILYGLSINPSPHRSFLGIDRDPSPHLVLKQARKWSIEAGIDFQFKQADDLDIQLDPVDFLSIDSNHTYRHLTYELETFSSIVRSVIVLHDTSSPWGYTDQNEQDHPLLESLYPAYIDRKKRGLWAAVSDFLEKHAEWMLMERKLESPGVTVICRNNGEIKSYTQRV